MHLSPPPPLPFLMRCPVYDKQRQQCTLMPFALTASSAGHEVFLLTFSEASVALCQRERQPKRQAGEAVIQSEVLRISPGSSSFSNYPPGGILAVLDNNGSRGCRPVTSQVWVEEANEGSGEMFALLLCHLRSMTPKQTCIMSCTESWTHC